ncbi:MAG: hypothetical protein V7707_10210 [Motiliproteus sp.]
MPAPKEIWWRPDLGISSYSTDDRHIRKINGPQLNMLRIERILGTGNSANPFMRGVKPYYQKG